MRTSKLLPLIVFLLLVGSTQILSAQGISYQAVARNSSGTLMANESINVEFIILENGTTSVYSETHAVTTNDYALFSVVVGKGTVGSGTFANIDWGGADHFLQVKIDGVDMGSTQLETVPYSKVATEMKISQLTDVNIGAVAVDDVLKWNGSEWVAGTDVVDDADADPANEIQTLSLNGSNLTLSNGGGTVSLPSAASDSSSALAWGFIDSSGAIISDYGVSTVANPSTGTFLVTIDKTWSTRPILIVTSFNTTPAIEVATTNDQFMNPGNQFEVNIVNSSGTGINSAFYFVVYGIAQ
ncbi:MAG: hypothetical protein R3B93_05595 [Bacteroidia bacterium]